MLIPDEEKERQEDALSVVGFEKREEDSLLSFGQAFARASNAQQSARLSTSENDNLALCYDEIIQNIRKETNVTPENPVFSEISGTFGEKLFDETWFETDGQIGERRFNPAYFEFDIKQAGAIPPSRERKALSGFEKFERTVKDLTEQFPGLKVPSRNEINKAAQLKALGALEREQQGVDGTWAGVGRVLGSSWGAMHDIVNLQMQMMTAFINLRGGAAAAAGFNGLTSMVSETAIQQTVDPYHKKLEIAHDRLSEIVASGVGGTLVVGAGKLGGVAVKKITESLHLNEWLHKGAGTLFKNDAKMETELSGEAKPGAASSLSHGRDSLDLYSNALGPKQGATAPGSGYYRYLEELDNLSGKEKAILAGWEDWLYRSRTNPAPFTLRDHDAALMEGPRAIESGDMLRLNGLVQGRPGAHSLDKRQMPVSWCPPASVKIDDQSDKQN